jgi:hypothetical protein
MTAHRRRLVFWAKSKRLKEPPAEPPIVTGLAQRVSHTREARVQTPDAHSERPGASRVALATL